ncbi:MAG TPA: flagellar motor switch protein FliG [Bryobacteraceae bacterium]|jgi:flagellar motor switch protein FliG|nr:flagellar motor switch protein FliG [Bryobacteraceae bacterium]
MAAIATAPKLTGLQKTAILLVLLGDEASGVVLRHLNDEEIEQVTGAIATLPPIAAEQAEAILEEFRLATTGALQLGSGGAESARRMLTHAFGPEGSLKHLSRLPQGRSGIHQQLQRIDPQLLVRFVTGEHPQTAALILSRLAPGQSAAVLASLEPALRADVAMRVARLNKISPAVFSKISSVIGEKLKSIGEVQRESSGGPRVAAEILNELDSAMCDAVLEQIGQQYADLAEEIRQKMFVFEDLLSIDGSGVTELLSRVDRRQLTIALKGASAELRQHLLKGLSQRGAAMLLEDMEALGAIKIRDVEGAQQQVIATVRQMESEGTISRNRGGGKDEQFV